MEALKELDRVSIPEYLAQSRGVYSCGTIVWYVPGATFATVECLKIDDNKDGLKTEVIDINVEDLTLIK